MTGPSKTRAWFAMSLRVAGRANRRPMAPAFPNLMSTIIAILIRDTHRGFDPRANGSERAFALLASEKRVIAEILVAMLASAFGLKQT